MGRGKGEEREKERRNPFHPLQITNILKGTEELQDQWITGYAVPSSYFTYNSGS